MILILADDMGYGDLSRINGGISSTPHLDQLAEEGVWFEQAYAASAVCAPSRAALLTGIYPHETGCVTLGVQRFPELTRIYRGIPTMAEAFAHNGYATGLIGKWHCGEGEGYHPMDRGFQEFEGFLGYMVNSYFEYALDLNGSNRDFKGQYLTDELSQRAIEFVRRHKNGPFFLHLAHYAPHRPIEAPAEVVRKYLDKGHNETNATIYAMIEIMDSGIGALMEELDRQNIRDNTIIIFSSDNGPDPIPGPRFNQALRGSKYTVFEGGIHVPFIWNHRGTLNPGKRTAVVHFIDVFPTLAAYCNLQFPEPIEFRGMNLVKTIYDQGPVPMEARFWQWNRGVPIYSHNAAMREGPWKLVRPYVTRDIPEKESPERPVLYNIALDPGETTDVSARNGRIYENMRVRLEQWCRKMEFERLRNDSK